MIMSPFSSLTKKPLSFFNLFHTSHLCPEKNASIVLEYFMSYWAFRYFHIPYSHLISRVLNFAIFAKFNSGEKKVRRKLKSRNVILYNINKFMKFKLLLYYCYSNMSQLHVFSFEGTNHRNSEDRNAPITAVENQPITAEHRAL